MKKYSKSAIILLAALALTGCSKTEEFEHNPDNALQIESVSGISPFALMQEPASKAVITGETLPGGEATKGIGLFVTATDGTAYDGKTTGYSNVKYAYSSEKWSAASPIYLSNTAGKLYGYFPYNVDAANLTAIPVVSSLNGTDYLYATSQDVSFSNKSVNLQMNHALARLHLTIKKGDKYLSDCSLTKIVLQSKAIDANGTMDITTGAVTATKAADATGTFELTGTDAVSEAGIEKDILLVPADNSEGKKDITLTLTIDGVDAEVKFTADKGLDIRSGIQCNATLTIEDTGIKVTGVGIGVWGDGGSQSVKVDGYTVTVKRSNETGIAEDVFLDVTSYGSTVMIKAFAATGRLAKCTCTPDGKATCTPSTDAMTGVCTFTISDVQEDITAEVGYWGMCTICVNFDSSKGIVKLNGNTVTSGTEVPVYAGVNKLISMSESGFRFFRWSDAEKSRELSHSGSFNIKVMSDTTITAEFCYADAIPGLFSVENNKKVFFSKGNLWCGTDSNPHESDLNFESDQYEKRKNTDFRTASHIIHFMWCDDVSKAMSIQYENKWDGASRFFTDESNFVVNGVKSWRTLTRTECAYLLNNDVPIREGKHKCGVKICGNTNCLVILPDDWDWSTAPGGEWKNEYSATTTPTWLEMESAGAVCLYATGFRANNTTNIQYLHREGYYWLGTPGQNGKAYFLKFSQGYQGYTCSLDTRSKACAVRLVTEYQSEPSAE